MCPCCGFMIQESHISIMTPLDNIRNMGTSTYLYFAIFKKLTILLVILTIFYSIFSLATNIIASNGTNNAKTAKDYLAISIGSKMTNQNITNEYFYFGQCFLGAFTMIVWVIGFIYIKYT